MAILTYNSDNDSGSDCDSDTHRNGDVYGTVTRVKETVADISKHSFQKLLFLKCTCQCASDILTYQKVLNFEQKKIFLPVMDVQLQTQNLVYYQPFDSMNYLKNVMMLSDHQLDPVTLYLNDLMVVRRVVLDY